MDSYNNTIHTTINTTPNKAAEKVDMVAQNIRKKAVKNKTVKVEPLFVGDKVRKKIFKGKLDKSSTQNFSTSIYKISNVIKPDKPYKNPAYKLINSNGAKIRNLYNANDLLKIYKVEKPPKQYSGSKTSKKKK